MGNEAQPQREELKSHGDELADALKQTSARGIDNNSEPDNKPVNDPSTEKE